MSSVSAAEKQLVWREPSGLTLSAIVGVHYFCQRFFPVRLFTVCECPQHGEQALVETFNLPIPLWMIQHCVGATETTNFLELGKQLVFKFSIQVVVDSHRKVILQSKVVKDFIHDCLS